MMVYDICEIKSLREDLINKVSKNMKDKESYENTANLFKLLGDYNRIRIINALKISEMCVCELSILLDMSQSNISHQLRILRDHNIVINRKENKKVFYSLNNRKILNLIEECEELV
ncbi:metalloregulator ArsR/SmtB family transcription factor [uncultured Methanobrevibacter sp.]|uniref:ArsR/SmtB family transcription factor n=1 Tax=uncultured Methanobrevibacter sp. TaxID=253161 RepID=UPI0034271BFD